MFKAVIFLGLAAQAAAYGSYVAKIPNGDKVEGVGAIGHTNPSGGGPRNPFGLAFDEADNAWTTELCKADSDTDGATNGEELGDPCCTWKVGTTLSTAKATHPGKADTFTPDQLKSLKCITGGSGNATNATTTSSPSGTAATPSATPTASSAASLSGAMLTGAAVAIAMAIQQ
ncbi:hypothetical protein H257_10869 [Aphanomyces astaci]|uniref:Temptin Cys/Cys disulfide domain-containing protein n=1 Tax=Aphanomyces astaci TaxID=112090 RepID=W4G6W3_APHAT|nr:hypothetical protein H257_10868 [Aphanomyces astaci]XP_009835892.1 hypothetical protein H257_10869 [Aphanomyces astaci]ETV74804.1 hypothetical protein H257_10868 [Aphanomyces astaci]ETV74805.1 hypothetical protein H257_10869 [Aphanomyces astaci]|eukprot:XP_009835891.1 hypothetical protein H257_10868 [Aphanomyces astaci]